MESVSKDSVIRVSNTHPQAKTIAPSQRHSVKTLHGLNFLRPENMLPPAHHHYVPPTAHQIRDLALWSGIHGGGQKGIEPLAKAANIEKYQMMRWTRTNIPVDQCPTVPGPVWQYLLIRLGVVEQLPFRRAEPETHATETFTPEGRQPLILRAKLWYERDEVIIDLFDDSIHSQSRKDHKPICSVVLPHTKSEFGNTIGGKLRHDAPDSENWAPFLAELSKAHQQQRLHSDDAPYYFSFLNKKVWDALWKLHDFHSISPRDFLKSQNFDPFHCKTEELPTYRELLSFIRWSGMHRNDLAFICGEKPERLAYLSSGKGEEKVKQAVQDFEAGKIGVKDLGSIRWANVISRHAWALMLTAFGISPAIPVIGRTTPNPRRVRTFELESVQGVPTKFVKIESLFNFNDAAYSSVTITGKVSTEKGAGEDWSHTVKITKDLDGHLHVDGAVIGKNTLPPTSWQKIADSVPEVAKSYINMALWHSLGRYIQFYHIG
ncbi:hypothetical protein AB9X29_003758 [Vibrio vulnificus]